MREFSDKPRFTVRTIPEIHEKVSVLVSRFRTRGFKLAGSWSREAMVNAVFLEFDALPPADQAAFLRRGLARLEALLGEEGPAEEGGVAPSGGPSVSLTDVTPPRSGRGKRRGTSG